MGINMTFRKKAKRRNRYHKRLKARLNEERKQKQKKR